MPSRDLFPARTVVAALVLALLTAGAAAQTGSSTYAAPRTPWGDPDLQGNYTNLWEAGTPFERPDSSPDARLEDIKGDELAKIRRGIQDARVPSSSPETIGGTRWIWLDSHDHVKGSMAWFVVDPPDGKIPPLTAEARARQAARAEARKKSGRGPADSYTDRSLYDRCISRGVPGLDDAGDLRQLLSDRPGAGLRGDSLRDDPRDASHPARRSAARLPASMRSYMGDARGRWEGDTLVVETTNIRDEIAYRGSNAATLKLVERFTRIAPDKVRWAVTVDDPSTWAGPGPSRCR